MTSTEMLTRRSTILALLGGPAAAAAAALADPATRPTSRPATRPASTTRPAVAEPVVTTFDPTRATRINLNFRQAPPKLVFESIAAQGDIVLRPNPKDLFEKDLPRIDIELRDASLFTAIRRACDLSGLTLQRVGAMREFTFMQGRQQIWGNYPYVEHGPFMVTVRYLQRQNVVDLTTNTTTRVVRVQLSVYTEPRLRVVRSFNAAALDEARDERGTALARHEDAKAVAERPAGGSWSWAAQLPLATPPDGGSTLALLRGHARAIVVTKSASAEIPFDPAMRDHTTLVGKASVTVKEVKRQGEHYVLTLAAEPDPERAEEWSKITIDSTFRLVDKDGRNLMRQQYGVAGGKTTTLMFLKQDWNGGDPAGDPVKLIWDVPVEMREVKIPFEFRDLPLP